jgi:hypothetical protein
VGLKDLMRLGSEVTGLCKVRIMVLQFCALLGCIAGDVFGTVAYLSNAGRKG